MVVDLEEFMRLAKDSQCACKVCALLRRELISQAYAEITKMKAQIKDMEDAQSD